MYGISLNRNECINITMNQTQSDVHFSDKVPLNREASAEYLGSCIADDGHNSPEISSRISKALTALRALGVFFRNSSPVKFKLQVYNSVVNAILIYSLETNNISVTEAKRLNAFQIKCFRRVLGVPQTFIDKSWTNEKVIRDLKAAYSLSQEDSSLPPPKYYANKRKLKIQSDRMFQPLSVTLLKRRHTLLGHVLRRDDPEDPMRQTLFEDHTWIPRIARPGTKPFKRLNWLALTMESAFKTFFPKANFDITNNLHITNLKSKADGREGCFGTNQCQWRDAPETEPTLPEPGHPRPLPKSLAKAKGKAKSIPKGPTTIRAADITPATVHIDQRLGISFDTITTGATRRNRFRIPGCTNSRPAIQNLTSGPTGPSAPSTAHNTTSTSSSSAGVPVPDSAWYLRRFASPDKDNNKNVSTPSPESTTVSHESLLVTRFTSIVNNPHHYPPPTDTELAELFGDSDPSASSGACAADPPLDTNQDSTHNNTIYISLISDSEDGCEADFWAALGGIDPTSKPTSPPTTHDTEFYDIFTDSDSSLPPSSPS